MLNVGNYKLGFAIGAAMFVRGALPALITMLSLRGCMAVFGESLDFPYASLLVISGLLAFILFPVASRTEFYVAQPLWVRAFSTMLSWLLIIAILLFLFYVTKSSAIYSRRVLITWFLVTPILVLFARIAISELIEQLMISSGSERHVVIAGANPIGVTLANKIAATPHFGIVTDGFFEDRSRDRMSLDADFKILGSLAELPDYVRQNRTDVIFIAMPIKNVQRVTQLLDELHDTTASIYFVPDVFVFDLIQCRTVDIRGIPAVALCETPFYGFHGVAKRLLDIGVALTALIALSPVMLVTAILVKATSPGSIIFKQRRYGLDGKEIVVYKFRSMTVSDDADDVRQATRDDIRLTPIGGFIRRYSIDELPQFINVLQGRMSIVGPRPHAVAHNEQYRKIIKGYMVRHKVTPGITGLAQVSGFRGETETVEQMEKRITLDLDYLRKWSIGLDIRIIFRTIVMIFRDSNAY